MPKRFTPSKAQRKELRIKRKQIETRQAIRTSNGFEISMSKLVTIKALDFSLEGAIDTLFGFKPKRAILIDRVFISTTLPLPRKVWFKVVALLEYEVKKYEEAKKLG